MTSEPSAVDPRLAALRDFKGRYPRQLWWLFLSEMWERFCFYGMRGVLTVFMIQQLALTKADANLQYGAIQAFVYAMTFVGGFFADKILGFRKSITWGGLLMIVGSFTVAAAPRELFYIGTSISIVGTGFFKPNISGIVGLLYNDGDPRRDAGFGLFYSGINVGAALGGFLCVYLGKAYGWEWAFISAGLAMTAGVLIFGLTAKSLGPLGFSPLVPEGAVASPSARNKILAVYLGSLLSVPLILLLVSNSEYTDYFMYTVGPAALLYFLYDMRGCTRVEVEKLMAALVFIVFSVFFWAFFEQSGGSLAIVAEYHVQSTEVLGARVDAIEVNNTANSIFVIVLSPLLGLLWLWMKKTEPNTVVKFGLGFFFLGGGFYLFHSLIYYADSDGISSLALFSLAWLVTTVGELCLSPIGLSAMTRLSPKRMFGIIMGLWFLASAYGQYLAGLLGAGMASVSDDAPAIERLQGYTNGYQQLTLYAMICGAVLIAISPFVRKLMHDEK
ncbi:peptide MFS transporter [Enhygromyxa salina]|uniref:Dipeptide and tripeptide permease B n=1 Tax=Enhygromyxa salina TaxID=215803 RepID=A0A2S9YTV9_9BACT|nr:peptide MFS transporter [Enhygromyxa salina]PRQ08526.1 Dipeptide and tripeptide permease B [Enhygromyxa salina]